MKNKVLTMAMAALVLGSCGLKNTTEMSPSEPVIGKNEIKLDSDRLTAEALWAMGRIGQAEINEQTGLVVYSVTYYSVEQNKSNSELFLLNPADGTTVQLTNDNHYQGQAHWLSDDMIAYLSDESGSSQVWTMKISQNRAMKVNELKQITNYEKDIEDFVYKKYKAMVEEELSKQGIFTKIKKAFTKPTYQPIE